MASTFVLVSWVLLAVAAAELLGAAVYCARHFDLGMPHHR